MPVTLVAFQTHPVGVLVDESVNWTVSGAVPEVLSGVNPAIGTGSDTLMNVTWVETLYPPELEAFRLIEKFPIPKIWLGLLLVLNVNGVLLPVTLVAFQTHPVGVLVDVSVNWTVRGAVPEVLSGVKPATGTGSDTLMNVTWVDTLDPPEFEAFRLIEKFPILNS